MNKRIPPPPRKKKRDADLEAPPSSRRLVIRSRLLAKTLHFTRSPTAKVLAGVGLMAALVGLIVFNHYWWRFDQLVDQKLADGPFHRTSRILAAPEAIYVGEAMTQDEVLLRLREAGYSSSRHNEVGHYLIKDDSIEIYPGPLSYFAQEPAVIYIEDEKITRVVSLNDNIPQTAYELEPELVTVLFDDDRSKRRLYEYKEYPDVLVNAVIAIEDHRFFDHYGIDLIRFTKAALDGLLNWEQPRGTSTLTQQLARNFFLTREQTAQRKAAEMLIAFQLELRLTKQQIFEYYANQIFMGRSGSFNVMGMGEAARAYFDKDVRDVTLAEAALLAGLPQGPSYLNPYRYPDRAKARRAQVLAAMRREGFITAEQQQQALQEELHLARGHIESSDAPYYVDLVNGYLREHFAPEELITENYWVYTTLDQRLQEAAVEAVRIGMEEVDKRIARQRRFKGKTPPQAQAALVALDPKTGEVKAIVGGRNYSESQLNRVLAKRQPGSVFKPFVFAAALETGLPDEHGFTVASFFGEPEALTAATIVDDVPTTFWFNEKPYEPSNYGNKIYGLVTFRYALERSINIATVKAAELVGYDKVADIARRAGIGDNVQPTPSIALGAYEASPLEVAGAYTAFLNGGVRKESYFVRLVRDAEGRNLHRTVPREFEVTDPRVAYIVTDMLEDVLLHGTGAGARYTYGFQEPAAGKTGTDDDGWFAGFTENLLCVVWVGFDDNTDLSLEGADSALPIWAEFMKRAHELRPYRNPEPFEAPDGVVEVELDADTHELATFACANRVREVFIAGTQPRHFCSLHGANRDVSMATNVAGWGAPPEDSQSNDVAAKPLPDAPVMTPPPAVERVETAPESETVPDEEKEPKEEKKNGFFKRVFGIFK